MATYKDRVNNKPPGQRTGHRTTIEVFPGMIKVAWLLCAASMAKKRVRQSANLAKLPECKGTVTEMEIHDFLGSTVLDLDLVLDEDDWMIPPSPWQALRLWEWLKRHAPGNSLSMISKHAGFDTTKAVEDEIVRRLDEAEKTESAKQNAEFEEPLAELV